MKRMMINATQSEELRVAIADGQKLLDLDIETPAHEQKRANIYKAKITRVERSLEACFVDYGTPRNGFLPFKEINPNALDLPPEDKKGKQVKDLLKEGQELIVQVDKEERGTKGAALSTYISLAGRYSVLMPNNPSGGGVSRRISGTERDELRSLMDRLKLPKGMGLIIRTAGMGRDIEELQWDIDYLTQLWEAIKHAASEHEAPLLIYQESNLFIRALRDYLRDDIAEILIDDADVYNKAVEFMQMVMPHNLRRLKHYQGETPLFTRFQIESQIETAFTREVNLPSGGSLVIDHTEALLSIDINSARATKGADIEETALQTNLEAAEEIARQLRLRDLGGLIVIDFIDMGRRGNQRKVEEKLTEVLKQDRARIQMGRISRFGLLEMSRQRMRPSLGESSYQTCPRCQGNGSIRSVESLALSILRLVEEEALKDNTGQILVQVPTNVANYMLNEKREAIRVIEQRYGVPVMLLANSSMETPQYEIKRQRPDEIEEIPSYDQVTESEPEQVLESRQRQEVERQKPIVDRIHPSAPAPVRKHRKAAWLQSLLAMFANNQDTTGGSDAQKKQPAEARASTRAGEPKKRRKKQAKKPAASQQPARQSKAPAQTRDKRKKTGKKAGKKKTAGSAPKGGPESARSGASQKPDKSDGDGKPPRRRGKRGGRRRRGAPASGQRQQTADQSRQATAQNADQSASQPAQSQSDARQSDTTAPPGQQQAARSETSGGETRQPEQRQPAADQTASKQERPREAIEKQQPETGEQRARPEAIKGLYVLPEADEHSDRQG